MTGHADVNSDADKCPSASYTAPFDEIVAAFGDQPRCQMSSLVGAQCLRPARWRINLHGCEQVNMCTQHKTAWVRKMRAQHGNPCCAHCGHEFGSFNDAVRITAI